MKLSLLINVDCIHKIANICGAKFVGHPVLAFAILASVPLKLVLLL